MTETKKKKYIEWKVTVNFIFGNFKDEEKTEDEILRLINKLSKRENQVYNILIGVEQASPKNEA